MNKTKYHDVINKAGEGVLLEGRPDLFIPESDLQKIDGLDDETIQARVAGRHECQRCGEFFEPRTGTGGRKQKYCTEECRRTSDNERKANAGQRAQRAGDEEKEMTMTQGQFLDASRAISEATLEGAKAGANVRSSVEPDFDWRGDECVVLQEQHSTAIYFNAEGGLVIRQQNWPDDDDVVIITKPCIDGFMDKLCDALGIGAYGRSDG